MENGQKTEIRNYLTAAGFLLLFTLFVISLLASVVSGGNDIATRELSFMTTSMLGVVLFIVGTLLVIVRGRDLTAITFILTGILQTTYLLGNGTGGATNMFAYVNLLWAVILLFAEDKQKILLFFLNLLMGLVSLHVSIPAIPAIVLLVIYILILLLTLYCAFAAGFERISLPGRNLICANTDTDFKKSGSSIGYLIFALTSGCWALIYLAGSTDGISAMQGMEKMFGFALIVLAVLLFAIAKMRFTPIMFLLIGAGSLLASFSTGIMVYAVGILFLVTGIFAIMRKKSRILPGIMLILYGCSAFASGIAGGAGSGIVSLILNIIPCLIALYLAAATLSQRKMPLF